MLHRIGCCNQLQALPAHVFDAQMKTLSCTCACAVRCSTVFQCSMPGNAWPWTTKEAVVLSGQGTLLLMGLPYAKNAVVLLCQIIGASLV